MIETERLFDSQYYANVNLDLAANGIDTPEELTAHFTNFGLEEGRQFSPWVNLDFYAASNPELGVAGVDTRSELFAHLQNEGIAQGFRFSPLVDLRYYQANNPQLQPLGNNFEALFRNLQDSGINQNLPFVRGLDLNAYLAANSDLNQAFGGMTKAALDYITVFGTQGRPGIASSLDARSAQIQTSLQLIGDIGTGNIPSVLEVLTPTARWEFPGNTTFISPNQIVDTNIIPFAGTWYGTELFNQGQSVGNFFQQVGQNLENSQFQPLDIFQDGNRVLARVNVSATVRSTGLPFNFDNAFIFDIADSGSDRGQIESVELVLNSHELAQAFAGQQPSAQAIDATQRDPLTGQLLSVNPNANSEASLAAVRNFFQLGVAQDPAVLQTIAPDSVFVADGDPGLFPLAGVQQGAEVFAEEQQVLQLVNPTLFQPFQYIANGDRVAVLVSRNFSHGATGIPVELQEAYFFTVGDNGLINNRQLIVDTYPIATAFTGAPPFV